MTEIAAPDDQPSIAAQGLQRLKSMSWRSVLQVVIPVLAVSFFVNQITGLDLAEIRDELGGATWWLAAVGFVVAQTPRLAQTMSTLGASPDRIPARPVYLLQLAQSYVGLAVPTSAARIAMNVRFFQKQGFSSGRRSPSAASTASPGSSSRRRSCSVCCSSPRSPCTSTSMLPPSPTGPRS